MATILTVVAFLFSCWVMSEVAWAACPEDRRNPGWNEAKRRRAVFPIPVVGAFGSPAPERS